MKKITIFLFILFGGFYMNSCSYDLGINTNPNAPSQTTPELRLPPILNIVNDVYGSHGTRVGPITQLIGTIPGTGTGGRNYYIGFWYFSNNVDAYVWQTSYVYGFTNIFALYTESQKVGAYHYIGVGKVMEAFLWGMLIDAYGLVNYDEACKGVFTPDYQEAEYVYPKILQICDEAVENLNKTQDGLAPALSKADQVYNGDVAKWIKFAKALKARTMSHLNKKAKGTSVNQYNPEAILALIAQSFSSNADDADFKYSGATTTTRSILHANYSANYKIGSLFRNYMLNDLPGSGKSWNSGIVDPRADLMLPKITASIPEKGQYSFGIDFQAIGSDFTAQIPFVPTNNTDGRFVGLITTAGGPGNTVLNYITTPFPYLSYAELKFIEAETYFRMGNKPSALVSYKAAITAHIDKISQIAVQVGLTPVSATAKTTFLGSAAVAQSADDLTLSHIMMQKYIALNFSPENWTDMRRNDFCNNSSGVYDETTGIYKGYKKPKYAYIINFPGATDFPRRYPMAYYETTYNAEKIRPFGAFDNDYMTKPIWWDKN